MIGEMCLGRGDCGMVGMYTSRPTPDVIFRVKGKDFWCVPIEIRADFLLSG